MSPPEHRVDDISYREGMAKCTCGATVTLADYDERTGSGGHPVITRNDVLAAAFSQHRLAAFRARAPRRGSRE